MDPQDPRYQNRRDYQQSLVATYYSPVTIPNNHYSQTLMTIPNIVCSLLCLDIGKRRDMLLETRSTLQDKSAKRKVKLADSYLYQQFDRYGNLLI